MEPVGVSLLITPWNSNADQFCSKLAMAIAAGCTTVIKPSELSAIQTQIVTEALHEAGLASGVAMFSADAARLLGPPSARIGRQQNFLHRLRRHRQAHRSRRPWKRMKRVTLGLGGKSPPSILDDADFATAVPAAITAAFRTAARLASRASRCSFHRAALRKSPRSQGDR